MNIKDQVLSIAQVRELQELGFDVEKYASISWLEKAPFIPIEQPKEYELEILTDSLIGNRGNLDVIPTLTIGDIISVLPPHIYPSIYHKKYGEEIEQTHILIMYLYGNFGCLICYKHSLQHTFVFESREKSYIKALFETLKWCIKQKHIAL